MRTEFRPRAAAPGFCRGQALVELACGLVTVTLVLSVLVCIISTISGKSPDGALVIQGQLRAEAGETALSSHRNQSRNVEARHHVNSVIREFASEFGMTNEDIRVREQVFVPSLKIY